MELKVTAAVETWPIRGDFRIARGSKSAAEVVVVTVSDGDVAGAGECVPYPRYGEDVASTVDTIRGLGALTGDVALHAEATRELLEAGAARNGLDCALWDWRARRSGQPVWSLLDIPAPGRIETAFTIGLGPAEEMARDASENRGRPLLKVKLGEGAAEDAERLRAVRQGAPRAQLIVDANEGWSAPVLEAMLEVAEEARVAMIEQPLPAGEDDALRSIDSPIPIGADESVHTRLELESLRDRYQVVNVKLDKAGGLTEALTTTRAALASGFEVMVGCMVATSLSMAPASLLAPFARFVDLDGPLLLAQDRRPGLVYHESSIEWPRSAFWGIPRSL